jgi:hypothetical protein
VNAAEMTIATTRHSADPKTDASFFALLTEQQIKRGAHRSTQELEAAITAYIEARNKDPKPFRWTKSADDILASIERFCRRTLAVQTQCESKLQNRDTS